jgi:hypothetical protein
VSAVRATAVAVVAAAVLATACADAGAAAGSLAITTSATTVSTRGFLSIRARCDSSTLCRGTMTVRAFGRVIGRASFAIRAHRAGVVVSRIDPAARRRLQAVHRTRATVSLVARYATVARYVAISAPRGGFAG